MLKLLDSLHAFLDSFKMADIGGLRRHLFRCKDIDLGIDDLNVQTCRHFKISVEISLSFYNIRESPYTVKSSTKSDN